MQQTKTMVEFRGRKKQNSEFLVKTIAPKTFGFHGILIRDKLPQMCPDVTMLLIKRGSKSARS